MRGFRFTCIPGCIACCDMKGYVYLTEDDVRRIAAYLGLSVEEFEAKHIYRTRNFRRLRKPKHSQCAFLNADGCAVHPVKPTQCRMFPFWPEVIGSRQGLREAAAFCPGIGKGPWVPMQTAVRLASEMRKAYPAMYE